MLNSLGTQNKCFFTLRRTLRSLILAMILCTSSARDRPFRAAPRTDILSIITIKSDDDVKGAADRLTQALAMNRDMYKIGSSSWTQQFKDAVTLEVEEGEIYRNLAEAAGPLGAH